MGLDRSASAAIVIALVLLTTALVTAYKLYYCRRNRDLRNDEMRTANTGQYQIGKFSKNSLGAPFLSREIEQAERDRRLLVYYYAEHCTVYFFLDFCFAGKTCRVKMISRQNDILRAIVKNCSSKVINN